jgi:hypothetical protein
MNNLFPAFTSSDEELNITYRYRCELYGKHIKKTPVGRVITEFLADVPWAGPYNTINCAASHHFREGRWLKDVSPLNEYAIFWCTEGHARTYSFPIADSLLSLSKVTGSFAVADQLYPRLAELHKEWNDHKNAEGMYFQDCNYDGMEFSISGHGIRPTINSYMYADKKALAELAYHAKDTQASERYNAEAEWLRNQINERLWNDKIGMFGVISKDGIMQNVKEQIGYIPWIYDIPNSGKDACFRNLFAPECFSAPYGLRTADASHPDYRKAFNHECLWNGPIWPFATSQTLTALISYLHTEKCPVVTHEEFMSLLLKYAYSHRDTDGTPYLDENMDPDTGIWLAREIMREWKRADKYPDRGRHYNHSSFIDLVMTGICGIRPSADNTLVIAPLGTSLEAFSVKDVKYHGHSLSINWEKSTGLTVILDETKQFFCKNEAMPKIEIELF